MDLQFTAEMEQKLDDIAEGQMDWLTYLRNFFLGDSGLENQVKEKESGIDPRIASGLEFEGLPAEIRIGQFGPFLAREEDGERLTAGLPEKLPPADLTPEMAEELLHSKSDGPTVLGKHPESALSVLLKQGPYGPYVQLGDEAEVEKKHEEEQLKLAQAVAQNGKKGKGKAKKAKKAPKPKRVSLLKGMEPDDVDLSLALRLLSLPRRLGQHPEDGKVVNASVGRFGPYVVHDGVYASIKAPDDVLEIELTRGLELLEEKKKKGGRSSASVLKELGEHPDGGKVQVLDGKYGPYVKYKRTNATLPKEAKPEEVTMAQAIQWINEKKAAGKGKKKK